MAPIMNVVADRQGLAAGDIIYSFAGVTAASEGGIQAIGQVVARSEGVSVPRLTAADMPQRSLTLLALRGSDRKMLQLTPRSGWGGRGLLGCHILPA